MKSVQLTLYFPAILFARKEIAVAGNALIDIARAILAAVANLICSY